MNQKRQLTASSAVAILVKRQGRLVFPAKHIIRRMIMAVTRTCIRTMACLTLLFVILILDHGVSQAQSYHFVTQWVSYGARGVAVRHVGQCLRGGL